MTSEKSDHRTVVPAKLSSLAFRNFKSFTQFTIQIRSMNILVGPNNSGKSTILDALRFLSSAIRVANRRLPATFVPSTDGLPAGAGWVIPASAYAIGTENLHANYTDEPAIVGYLFGSDRRLELMFGKQGNSRLYYFGSDVKIRHTADFAKYYDIKLSVTPTLGPFIQEEDRVDNEYYERLGFSRQASRYFRNYWVRNDALFPQLQKLLRDTWPEISIEPARQLDQMQPRLTMFCEERRISREIAWAGYGFQIWLQLLTHMINVGKDSIFVVDEPEIYLHPDLHKKVLAIARSLPARVLMATHSVEIINAADPAEVLVVERGKQSARRLSDIEGLQHAVESLGSTQNIQLSRLARAKRVLFVEGQDRAILGELAEKCGFSMFSDGALTVVPLGGFDPTKVGSAQWAFGTVLGQHIDVGVILDRDYRCSDEIAAVTKGLAEKTKYCMVLRKKEIENYIIVPRAIRDAVKERLDARAAYSQGVVLETPDMEALLDDCAADLKWDTLSQIVSKYLAYHQKRSLADGEKRRDSADLVKDAFRIFEEHWQSPQERMAVVGGKQLLSKLNERLSIRFKITISARRIVARMRREDVDTDLLQCFEGLRGMLVAER